MSTESLFVLVREIRHKIAQAETDAAVALALGGMQEHPRLNELIMKSAELKRLEEDRRKGKISRDDAEISQNQINDALLRLADVIEKEQRRDTRVFISYSQREPDASLAKTLYKAIQGNQFEVFIADENMIAGQNWAKRILHEIRMCDFFIVLLSPDSNQSEMVLAEVREAKKIQETHAERKPHILPIRVNLPDGFPLNDDLAGYLKEIHYLSWKDSADTPALAKTLNEVLKQETEIAEVGKLVSDEDVAEFLKEVKNEDSLSEKPLPCAPIEKVGGAMMPDSPFYIEREGEEQFRKLILQPAAILRIKGPRQHGKTSLLSKIITEAHKEHKFNTAHLSFQLLDRDALRDLDKLCYQLCLRMCKETGKLRELRNDLKEFWADDLFSVKEKCTTFMEEYLLPCLDGPLVLALDEADVIFKYEEVSNDFFAMLRAWHDNAPLPNKERWRDFKLVLSYSTEIHLAIKNLDQSPFNVGHEREMKAFVEPEVDRLVNLNGLTDIQSLANALIELTGGYPYLSRKALYLLRTQECDLAALKNDAPKDNGPFSDHLRHLLLLLQEDEDCSRAMRDIVHNKECHNTLIVSRLRAAGLVKGASPKPYAAHELYREYFKTSL